MRTFTQLHAGDSAFILANIWDVKSALIFQQSGYKAIGTSSHAVAEANGYHDGEQLPFELLLQLAKRVVSAVNIPLSVDIEGGYARTIAGITDNITRLHDAGVAGVNLEDTLGGKFVSSAEFTTILSAVASHISRNNLHIFINLRTDAFLFGMPDPLQTTLQRVKKYEDAGADGIFVPGIVHPEDIRTVVANTHLPVNVMCIPGLTSFDELSVLGVKRISMGGFLFNKIYQEVSRLANTIETDNSFSSIV